MPRPGRKTRIITAAGNSIIGTGLIIAGIEVSSKALIAAGSISLAGAAFLVSKK